MHALDLQPAFQRLNLNLGLVLKRAGDLLDPIERDVDARRVRQLLLELPSAHHVHADFELPLPDHQLDAQNAHLDLVDLHHDLHELAPEIDRRRQLLVIDQDVHLTRCKLLLLQAEVLVDRHQRARHFQDAWRKEVLQLFLLGVQNLIARGDLLEALEHDDLVLDLRRLKRHLPVGVRHARDDRLEDALIFVHRKHQREWVLLINYSVALNGGGNHLRVV